MGNQAPLYFILIMAITHFIGLSEISLRLISVIAGICLVLTAWWFTRRQTQDLLIGLAECQLRFGGTPVSNLRRNQPFQLVSGFELPLPVEFGGLKNALR